jgi:hypothetical protein
MIVILQEMVYLVPEEDSTAQAGLELAEHLDLEFACGVNGYLIADEQLVFRRTINCTNKVRCLGPTLWNT